MEDDLPRTRRIELRVLDPLGITELQDYIAELQAEIARTEGAMRQKQSQQNVEESFFRK